ncbi:5-formyltetrahydrofolate cyclo-ligase [Marinomonas colpomeniae]|uniref:5-formyltetrahydrofolate cyclo-ligase n=1 Tax=Marinomonas colpomeniae TaxID=2774408 RepID=A0ABR8P3C9_9GAMM|nr:5-formyltetrahydrofolate cyclo-ligase [Marinomonas colpomeniae]MBD5772360.1 5-formyltetrahydrofolate cyclo-ligase [Marinomonas colpomeniae]
MTSHLDPRQTLRRQLRQTRRNLSSDEQVNGAQNLLPCFAQYLNDLQTQNLDKRIQHPRKIALYLSNDGEISPHVLCEHFWQQNIETYLPVIQGKELVFALYSKDTIWQDNQFGIKEPVTSSILSGNELDIIFLPLVGFDVKGGRLGMGGGFYDRTFEGKRADQAPLLVGLAHDCQQVKSLPIEGWDVPLQAFITPTQVIRV